MINGKKICRHFKSDNMKIKIIIIGGARPNFIKIAPFLKEIKKHKRIEPILIHTGQHYDFGMSGLFFRELGIQKPDYHLGVGSGSNAWQTAETMERLEPILLKEKPNFVVVVGDVNSTLAGALTAARLGVRLVHIESGLRGYDRTMPEEVNRVLTDHLSDLLFCPTENAMKNLKKEGIEKGAYNVGDITYDTFLKSIKIAQKKSRVLKTLKLKPKSYFLLTLHRPQNVDNPESLKKILRALQKNNEKIIFPVHPRTKKSLTRFDKSALNRHPNFLFIEPVGFIDILWLEKNSQKIITDSGGVQKEAYWFKIPCITLRDTTEWVETVKNGWNILVGNDEKKIINAIRNFNPSRRQYNYFGNGKTAEKIVEILIKNFKT